MSKGRLQVGGVKLDMSWLNGGRWRRYLTVALLATISIESIMVRMNKR